LPDIILSDGLPCAVKVLPLYSLDHIGPKDIGDFTYKIQTLSGEYLQSYNLETRLDNPPAQPPPDSDDTWAITEWERFQAAIEHNRRRWVVAEERAGNVAIEVLRRCLEPADRDRILIEADYEAVYLAGVAQEVDGEALADQLRDFFQGQVRWPGNFSGAGTLQISPERRFNWLRGLSGVGDGVKAPVEPDGAGLFGAGPGGEGAADMHNETTGLDGSVTDGETIPGTETLIASLLLYEAWHGRVYHPSMQGWLFYYAAQQQLKRNYINAAVLEGMIEATRGQVVRILVEAQGYKGKKQKRLIKTAEALNQSIDKMRGQVANLIPDR